MYKEQVNIFKPALLLSYRKPHQSVLDQDLLSAALKELWTALENDPMPADFQALLDRMS